eukprot:6170099-Pleurochrysis_carterae.AAC.1
MTEPTGIAPTYGSPAAFAGTLVPDRDDHALAFPSDSVLLHSFPFLPWDLTVSNKATLPDWALCYIVLP